MIGVAVVVEEKGGAGENADSIFLTSTLGLIGLLTWSSMPASRQALAVALTALAVSAMIGRRPPVALCGRFPWASRARMRRRFVAIHFGHLTIHQDEIEPRTDDGFDGGDAVGDDFAVIAVLPERFGGDNLVDVVVFGQKDSQGTGFGWTVFQRLGHAFSRGVVGEVAGQGGNHHVEQLRRTDRLVRHAAKVQCGCARSRACRWAR